MNKCSRCKEDKPETDFYFVTRYYKSGEKRVPSSYCKECYRHQYYEDRGITEYGNKRQYIKKDNAVNIKRRYNNTQINIDGELIKIKRWVDDETALKLKRAGYYFIFSQ